MASPEPEGPTAKPLPAGSAGGPRSRRRRRLLVVAAVAGTLLLLEGALRAFNAATGRVPSFLAVERRVPFRPHPWLGHALKASFTPPPGSGYPTAETNRLGFPGPELARLKPDGVRRVVCLGGSVTFGAGAPDEAATYPRVLERLLREGRDEPVEVINAGVPYYTAAESLVNYALRLHDLTPDAVVVYHGLNDRIPMMFRGFRGDYTHLKDVWHVPEGRSRSVLSVLEGSHLVAELLNLARGRDPGRQRDLGAFIYKPPGSEVQLLRGRPIPADGFRVYRRNLEHLCALARDDGALVVLHTAATRPGFLEGGAFNRRTVPRHNRTTREVAEERGVGLVDNAAAFPAEEALFADNIHLSEAGQALLAERTRDALLEAGLFERPPREAVQRGGR